MEQIIDARTTATTPAGAPDTSAVPRFDIYSTIHKGIRAFINSTVEAVGAMDAGDADEVDAVLAQTRELLAFCRSHLAHEDTFVHPAMQQRQPDSAVHTADDHVGHGQAIASLSGLVTAVENAHGAARHAAAQRLYRELTLFAAENFEHMHVEETENNAVLWANYNDPEILEIHGRLLASIGPDEMAIGMKWMMPAVSHVERVGMLMGMRDKAPAPVFEQMLASIRPLLSEKNWTKLERALTLQ